jgi:hypothetical protein
MMDWRAFKNTQSVSQVAITQYQTIDHAGGEQPFLTIDLLKGKHFWNPQVAIWLEDSTGAYLETLLVTTSTAKGLFYAGRSADNFKASDEAKTDRNEPTRRVDALPYWSHKRGQKYSDGFYSPPPDEPLPDGITSATPKGNFYFKSNTPAVAHLPSFHVMIELNIAFDENEYYSEYDYLEDSLYHGGTGLLGQPSLIYQAQIRKTDGTQYYIATLIGRGHHSGASGELFTDLDKVTTAKSVAERIVVGIDKDYYRSR